MRWNSEKMIGIMKRNFDIKEPKCQLASQLEKDMYITGIVILISNIIKFLSKNTFDRGEFKDNTEINYSNCIRILVNRIIPKLIFKECDISHIFDDLLKIISNTYYLSQYNTERRRLRVSCHFRGRGG